MCKCENGKICKCENVKMRKRLRGKKTKVPTVLSELSEYF
jgi:hypothetical protein